MLKILIALALVIVQINGQCSTYTTAESLYNSGPLSQFSPTPQNCGSLPCSTYIWGDYDTKSVTAENTCWGWYGPLSAYGPLSDIGPASDQADLGQVYSFIDQIYNPNNTQGNLYAADNPLSNQGPLGNTPFYVTMTQDINDFTMQMQGQGIWSVLGPLGPLGPLGQLGPLGPAGMHLFSTNGDGDYLDSSNNVVTSVSAWWNSTFNQTWPLFEQYTADHAKDLSEQLQLDTSFSVLNIEAPFSFKINSVGPQFVTILVVPTLQAQMFSITIRNVENQNQFVTQEIKTNPLDFINWVQLNVQQNSVFEVEVGNGGPNIYGSDCNFYIVGSTPWMLRQSNIQYSGNYIENC